MADLVAKYGIPVYDQVGCAGRSTRLREKNGDEGFWTIALFVGELDYLVDYFDLREAGGGILDGVYIARHPRGLRKLILADAPSSIPLLLKGERKKEDESDKYKQACLVFYKRHLCRLNP